MRILNSSIVGHIRVAIGTGVYFYEGGKCFKLKWQKGALKGSLSSKAISRDDAEAYKSLHLKFHAKAAEFS